MIITLTLVNNSGFELLLFNLIRFGLLSSNDEHNNYFSTIHFAVWKLGISFSLNWGR